MKACSRHGTPAAFYIASTSHHATASMSTGARRGPLMPCPHIHTRTITGRAGWPAAEVCSDCRRRRTLRADRHLHYNEDTGTSEWVAAAELESGRVPAGSVIVETEYHYGPWVT